MGIDVYAAGNEDGGAYTGCRGCYDHNPIDDVATAWAKSDAHRNLCE